MVGLLELDSGKYAVSKQKYCRWKNDDRNDSKADKWELFCCRAVERDE